jgi:hypothetical protein
MVSFNDIFQNKIAISMLREYEIRAPTEFGALILY